MNITFENEFDEVQYNIVFEGSFRCIFCKLAGEDPESKYEHSVYYYAVGFTKDIKKLRNMLGEGDPVEALKEILQQENGMEKLLEMCDGAGISFNLHMFWSFAGWEGANREWKGEFRQVKIFDRVFDRYDAIKFEEKPAYLHLDQVFGMDETFPWLGVYDSSHARIADFGGPFGNDKDALALARFLELKYGAVIEDCSLWDDDEPMFTNRVKSWFIYLNRRFGRPEEDGMERYKILGETHKHYGKEELEALYEKERGHC